jgi:hypothetical protein
MTKDNVYELAVKIIGLYFGFDAVMSLANYSIFYFPFETAFFINDAITILVKCGIAYVAIFKTDYIVTKITSEKDFHNSTLITSWNKVDLLEVGLAILAVFIFAGAIPGLINLIIDEVYYQERGDLALTGGSDLHPSFYYLVSKIALSIFLIANSRNFSKKIIRRGELDDMKDQENQKQ